MGAGGGVSDLRLTCVVSDVQQGSGSGCPHRSVDRHQGAVRGLSNHLSGGRLSLQTTSQTELENWITAIHSACSAAVARHHHKEDTLRLLRSEIKKLEQKIDMDEKMKKMGEMQLSSVTDSKKKKTILDQVIAGLLCARTVLGLSAAWCRCCPHLRCGQQCPLQLTGDHDGPVGGGGLAEAPGCSCGSHRREGRAGRVQEG